MSKSGARMTMDAAKKLAIRLAESGNDELLRQLEDIAKKGRQAPQSPLDSFSAPKGPDTARGTFKPKKLKKMTRAEVLVSAMLAGQVKTGEITGYEFEAVKLKIGDDTCWYICDFVCFLPDGRLRLVEAKGGKIWEDSIIKFKTAKRQYPAIIFQMYQAKNGTLERIL